MQKHQHHDADGNEFWRAGVIPGGVGSLPRDLRGAEGGDGGEDGGEGGITE